MASLSLDRHLKFFGMHIRAVPGHYTSLDTSRATLLYFCVEPLDLLGHVDQMTPERKNQIIEWLYTLQITSKDRPDEPAKWGFRGSRFIGTQLSEAKIENKYDEAHIAMTYTALATLRILGDDLSRVDKDAIIASLGHLQQKDGSFSTTQGGSEADMRFVYCACVIPWLLRPHDPRSITNKREFFGFDIDSATEFITSCQSWDGALALRPYGEGHGGSTYTGVASLALLDRVHFLRDRDALLYWCVRNQGQGFVGRPNKPADTCYSFWIGATLKMLKAYAFTHVAGNRAFNFKCQSQHGGFSKLPGTYPDLLHANFGLAGLSIMGKDGLKEVDFELGIAAEKSNYEERLRHRLAHRMRLLFGLTLPDTALRLIALYLNE